MNRARSGSFDGGRRRGPSSSHRPLRSRSLDRGRGKNYGSILERRASMDEVDGAAEWNPILVLDDEDGASSWKIRTAATLAAPCNLFLKDKELLRDEIAGMANLTIPVTITSFLDMLPGIVTIILVGRARYDTDDGDGDLEGEMTTASMKQLHLDAAALAVMIMNVVALSPAFGMLTAMDTLCSQAFGASQSSKMGTYSLTGITVISVMFLFSGVLMWNASSILIALGQPVVVSYMAGDFIRYLTPGVPFLCIYELIQKISQSRNEARPMLISTLMCNVVNLGLGYYLVNRTTWGWMGAAVSHAVGEFTKVPTVLLCMVIGLGDSGECEDTTDYSTTGNPQDTQHYLEVDSGADDEDESDDNDIEFLHHIWQGFVVSEALSPTAILEFLRIGVPGMLQVMFEWVAFEIIALLCGILPGQEAIVGIGANSIIMNVSSITYTLYQGIAVSGNVRVGNALGAGDAHRAEIASNLTFACGAILSLVNVALLLSFRNILPWIFTSDLDIIEKAQTLLLITVAFQFSDAFNACVQGVFRGSGRQALAATYNFIAFYIIGIPLGYDMGVREGFGVEGLWLGITAGLFSIAIGGTIVVLRSDWTKLASEANSRLSRMS